MSSPRALNFKLPEFAPTVLLVNDDPLQARVHRSILLRQFPTVVRAADAAEAFILVEESDFSAKVGLIVVGLDQPGLGGPAFVAELTQRLPSIPIVVLDHSGDMSDIDTSINVSYLPRTASSQQILALTRQMVERTLPQTA